MTLVAHGQGHIEGLTEEIARDVREWRCEVGATWRAVAQLAEDKHGFCWPDGRPVHGNQLAGEDLCVAAARVLGEEPFADPWN